MQYYKRYAEEYISVNSLALIATYNVRMCHTLEYAGNMNDAYTYVLVKGECHMSEIEYILTKSILRINRCYHILKTTYVRVVHTP